MVEIKNAISFDEYHAIIEGVVNSCFPDDTYSPNYYEMTFRRLLLEAFAPDYEIPALNNDTYNEVWERVMCEEACEILSLIRQNNIYRCLEEAIDNAIEYRIKMIVSGSMSMTDIALSKLVDTIAEKMDSVDFNMLSKEEVNTIADATVSLSKGENMDCLVNALLDNGLLAKPNRATRRKNGQRSKTNIKIAPKDSEETND